VVEEAIGRDDDVVARNLIRIDDQPDAVTQPCNLGQQT